MVLRHDLLAPAPTEGCALLLGQGHGAADSASDDWRVQLIWPCRNMVGQREHDRFELDPREQIAAQRWARAKALTVLGSAHSHPGASVVPSRRDRLWAGSSGLMLIMGNNKAIAAWWLEVEAPRCSLANVHPLPIRVMGETPLKSFPENPGFAMTEAGGAPQLSGEEKSRYARHITLPEVGVEGQQRLKAASVLCIGAGGLGSPLLLYLAAAGVGRIGVVDDDFVEPSNLQRQVIHGTGTVGQAKTSSARARIEDLNPFCRVEDHCFRLSASNALELFAAYDVVVDGTDNFASRYLINDACVLTQRPFVYGSVQRFEGQVSVFNLGSQSPDYRDLVPEPPPQELVPSCADGGVIGVMPGLIGLIQAAEVIKLITGIGTPLDGRLLLVDGLSMRFRELTLKRSPRRVTIDKLIDYEAFCMAGGSISGEKSKTMKSISVMELKAMLDQGDDLALIDVRNPAEAEVAVIAGSELIPLATLDSEEVIARIQAIAASRTVYVHCKLGGRSAKAVDILASHGIDAVNVRGGIDAWSEEIDPSVLRY